MLDYSREFIVLATHLNFTSAARGLNLSQPGLSRHITELEKYLGFELVTRSPVALTPAGRHYLENVSSLIEDFDRMVQAGRNMAKKAQEKIVVWQPPLEGRASQIFYEAIARASARRPSLEFEFRRDRTLSVLEAIAKGCADVGMIYVDGGALPEGVACDLLLAEPFSVLMRKDNPLASQESFTLKEAARCYLAFSTHKRYADWNNGVLEIYRREGLEPHVRVKDYDELSSFYASFQSDEISIVSPALAFSAQLNPSFVARMPEADGPRPYSSTVLAHREGASGSSIELFIELCKEVAGDIKKGLYSF